MSADAARFDGREAREARFTFATEDGRVRAMKVESILFENEQTGKYRAGM
jgi:hypothetical protein